MCMQDAGDKLIYATFAISLSPYFGNMMMCPALQITKHADHVARGQACMCRGGNEFFGRSVFHGRS